MRKVWPLLTYSKKSTPTRTSDQILWAIAPAAVDVAAPTFVTGADARDPFAGEPGSAPTGPALAASACVPAIFHADAGSVPVAPFGAAPAEGDAGVAALRVAGVGD